MTKHHAFTLILIGLVFFIPSDIAKGVLLILAAFVAYFFTNRQSWLMGFRASESDFDLDMVGEPGFERI